jgi:preprotein translocase subunit SecB
LHIVYKHVSVRESENEAVHAALGFDFQGVKIRSKVGFAAKKGQEKNPEDFLVDLGIAIENVEGKASPYSIDVRVLGVFRALPSLAIERREDLVAVNGASILYGVIREMVASLTSRFRAGPLTLPGMNFEDHAPSKGAIPQESAPVLESRRTRRSKSTRPTVGGQRK